MPVPDELLRRMRRFPEVEAPNLFAADSADRLILDEAAEAITGAAPGDVVVINDNFGALTLGAMVGFGVRRIRVHQDRLTGEQALANNAARAGLAGNYRQADLGAELLVGARVVLLQLPRSLGELTEIAEAVSRHAEPGVVVFAGGRDKHITHAMNEVLARSFESVQATRGRQKSRVLIARGRIAPPDQPTFPVSMRLDELGLTVVAHGAAFAGTRLDIGTRFLLGFLPQMKPDATVAVDLGCGTGIIAASLSKERPALSVFATDNSAAAVASTAATAVANGLAQRIVVRRDDAMASFSDAEVDLVVCNPPFHVGAAVHAGAALKLFEAAGRVLRPGGELWTVYNNHLNYRGALEDAVGPTEPVGRNAKFTVARSVR